MTFQSRLHAAGQRGDMSTADLAHWFDRPYATVRYWLYGDSRAKPKGDFEPRGAQGRLALRRLHRLEWAVAHDERFPIPADLGDRARHAYVKATYHAVDSYFSTSNST